MLQWKEDVHGTGDRRIDAQHQVLFARVNEFVRDIEKGEKDGQALGEMMEFLGQYATEHFRDEEAAMAKANCPALEENALQHQDFISRFQQMGLELRQRGITPDLSRRVAGSVVDWLDNHVTQIDTALRQSR